MIHKLEYGTLVCAIELSLQNSSDPDNRSLSAWWSTTFLLNFVSAGRAATTFVQGQIPWLPK